MHIDWWTLGLQTANVLVLVWLLARFFFKPVAAIVAQRQEAAQKLLADAEAARTDAQRARAEADAQRKRSVEAQAASMAQARKAAEQEAAAVLRQATAQAAKLRAETGAALARDRAAAQAAALEHASDLSVDIARRLLSTLPASSVPSAFVGALVDRLKAMSDADRAELRANGRLEVVSAAPLSEQDRKQVAASLAAALGSLPNITFATDATLIAGLELRGGSVAVRASWAAALERIRKELQGDGERG